jgi:hypothetical protein
MIASPSEKHKKGAKSSCGPTLEVLTVLITKNQLPYTTKTDLLPLKQNSIIIC